MIRVTAQRFLNKKKIYNPDKTHFHHYLIASNSGYVWQIILILTMFPIILFSFFIENLIFIFCISIMIYNFYIYEYIKKKIFLMKKIFYWSNDIQKNSGEGILAGNFLKLLKNKYKNYKYINLNKFKKKIIFYIIIYFHFGE